jgi:hypothetical protein
MSSEDAALAQRLQAKDNALRSLTKRYLAYTAAVESSSEEECKALYEGLMLEVDQYELAVGKAEALVDTNVRQVAEYDDMQQRVEAEMCVRLPTKHAVCGRGLSATPSCCYFLQALRQVSVLTCCMPPVLPVPISQGEHAR